MRTSGSGGDTIMMGRYPTNLAATAFADWGTKSHTVASTPLRAVDYRVVAGISVKTTSGATHIWSSTEAGLVTSGTAPSTSESYVEFGSPDATFNDVLTDGDADSIQVLTGSPSSPQTAVPSTKVANGVDDAFIDVELNSKVPLPA